MIETVYLCLSLALQASASLFFHEPSHIVLLPEGAGSHTSFGFSLAYQQNESTTSLVAGAPHSGLTGKVFKCPFAEVFTKRTRQCPDVGINVDAIAPYNRNSTPDLKLNLGVSISATPEYFFTCAPLWPYSKPPTVGTFGGTCFVHNGTTHRYSGMLEQYGNGGELASLDDIKGGTGWRTLIDPTDNVLMIAKVALNGDIAIVNASKPLSPVHSFVSKNANRRYFQDYQNIGISMVAGNFFDKTEVLYAISAYDSVRIQNTIHFLHVKGSRRTKLSVFEYQDGGRVKKTVKISVATVGTMFGAAMAAADLDHDGFSELLVGAPAADGEGGYESGALHIYLGGDAGLVNDISKHCVITGTKETSRFGAAIAASDVDGDDLPEIFVSAPYEDSGEGALYVLSGFEVNKQLIKRTGSVKQISLSKLKYTQRIKNSKFKTFGYSLQVIPDLDGNGCDELAVGSPGSENIMLLRCLPAIVVDLDLEQMGDKIVKEQDDSVTLKVCIKVKHLKQKQFSSTLKISNKVIGIGAYIEPDQLSFTFEVNGATKEPTCRDVIVKLSDNDPHEYKFYTNVDMDEGLILNSKDFNNAWATVSPNSVLEKSIDISRHCKDKDCEPNLSITIGWPGKIESYHLGSSELLTVSMLVKNEGHNSYDSCVRVEVSGASIAQFGCSKSRDGYKCYMPKPLRRFAEHKIDIKLNMSQAVSLDEEINVKAHLFDYCNKGIAKLETFKLKLELNADDIMLVGSSHNQDISDTEIQDVSVNTVNDAHEYLISNEGSVYWKNIEADISITKEPFIESYRVSAPLSECISKDMPTRKLFACTFDLQPRSTAKIIASTLITKSKIMENLVDGKLNITSRIILYLKPTTATKVERLSTSITLRKEQSLAQNKGLIIFLAVLGAAIALGLLVFIMYKMDFFKRKEKTKLNELKREHVRRQSVKRSMSMSQDNDGVPNMDMEVVDDCPFEIVDMTVPVLKEDRENDAK